MKFRSRMLYPRFLRLKQLTAIMLAAGLVDPGEAWADYRLAPGDVLDISVLSVPALRQRVTVNIEGEVLYPLVGSIGASGLTLAEIQSKLRNELANRSVRTRAPDGSESIVYIYPEEISVAVAEYRPIYVNGDVSRPGELPYRPKMTVRQAIALAGGLDVMRLRTQDPNLTEIDLRSEGSLLRMSHLREQALIDRLTAELSHYLETSEQALPASQVVSDKQAAQTEQLKLLLEDYRKEISSIGRRIEQTKGEISTLERLREVLTQSYQQQARDFSGLKASFDKGLVSAARISDEQRALSYASERLLQAERQLAEAKVSEEQLQREQQKTTDQRRLRLMRELEDAEGRLSEIQTRIRAAGDKLRYVSSRRSQLQENDNGKPSYKVFRKNGDRWGDLQANEDMELIPGDVVEVTLQQVLSVAQ